MRPPGRIRRAFQTAGKTIWGRRFDLCLWTGGVTIAIGIGCIYWPAGVIVAGAGIAWWGLIGARAEAAERRKARLA